MPDRPGTMIAYSRGISATGRLSPHTPVAAVRQRGYTCLRPEAVEHDPKHSEPDRKAWIIRCANGTFRVKFMGDTGAQVTRLD